MPSPPDPLDRLERVFPPSSLLPSPRESLDDAPPVPPSEVPSVAPSRWPEVWREARWRVTGSPVLVLVALALVVVLGAGVRVWWGGRGGEVEDVPSTSASPPSSFSSPLPAAPTTPPVATTTPTGEVIVYVVGQVRHPGVVRLPTGSRVADALTAAGGAQAKADLTVVNLARPLTDGEQLFVPRPGETPPVSAAAPAGTSGGGGSTAPEVVDLNSATEADLDALPGIGPVLAARIVQHRQEVGRFTSVDDLGDVDGIGDKLLSRLRPQVRV